MQLVTLEDQVGAPAGATTAPEMLAMEHWVGFRSNGLRLPPVTASAPVLPAVVNHGRWLVRCPSCMSASLASKRDRRFLCCECGNDWVRGEWLPVAFPAEADQIEAALLSRPNKRNQNWEPGETVAHLRTENVSHMGRV